MRRDDGVVRRVACGESSDLLEIRTDAGPRVLKVLHAHLADDPIIRARFLREAQLLSEVSHPNVVTVFGLRDHVGLPAMEMELASGGSLEGRRLSPGDTMSLLRALLGALATLHARGVVHRDIRPSHVVFDEFGNPKLTDFGMASIRDLSGLTRSTVFTSQQRYADPYAWGRESNDPGQDIYSLGAVAFEAVLGDPPPVSLFGGVNRVRTSPGDTRLATVDHFVATVIGLMLEAPAKRPRSAREILDWIEQGEVSGARRLSECLYCGAAMPEESAICLSCGRTPVHIDRDPNGEFIALRKISEDQDVLAPFLRKLIETARSRLAQCRRDVGERPPPQTGVHLYRWPRH